MVKHNMTELMSKSPAEIEKILNDTKKTYQELIDRSYQKCASILFYENEIEKMQPVYEANPEDD